MISYFRKLAKRNKLNRIICTVCDEMEVVFYDNYNINRYENSLDLVFREIVVRFQNKLNQTPWSEFASELY
jgi:hypothetical protein